MSDHLTKKQRSWNMSRIRSKNTTPEKKVRSLLHSLGYRFRLHRKDLPGKPDIVLPKHKIAICVNGCFWHRHKGCKKATTPKSNIDYWTNKFSKNVNNDARNKTALESLGWKVIIVWECETRDNSKLLKKLSEIY